MAGSCTISDGSTLSRDGTRIGFRRQGDGPGLVLVQGAMQTARQYAGLARALAPRFTVFSPDRRGRGMSPKPYEAGHTITRDVEDIDAVLEATGAARVFGLSSGAIITLEAARSLRRVERAAVYEPPFYPHGVPRDGIRRLSEEIERGDLAAGMISALIASGTAPDVFARLPRPVTNLLARVVLGVDARLHDPGTSLRDLVPGVRHDFNVVEGVDGRMDRFAAIDKPVLLLSGTRSPRFLRESVGALHQVVPGARQVELPGLGHDGPWAKNPRLLAGALRDFFESARPEP